MKNSNLYILLFLLILNSCTSKNKLIGKYKTFYNQNVIHCLEIKDNNTFIQKMESKDTLIINKGTWNLDNDGDLELKNWIDLNNFGNNQCYPNPCVFTLLFVDGDFLKKNESDTNSKVFKKQ